MTAQKELILNAGLGFVEHDFIQTKALVFETPKAIKNLIFTSQNGVKYFFEKEDKEAWRTANLFCVGEKTKAALEKKGLKVVEKASNSVDLGQKIAKNHQNEQFLFICGKQRRDELPTILKKNKVAFEERIVYKTIPNAKEISRKFEGLLFFSPSGVQSYVSKNTIGAQHCFCIGNTTANEVQKHTNAITIANKPTIENVIVQAVKKLK